MKSSNLPEEFSVIYENHALILSHYIPIDYSERKILIVPSLINGPEILYLNPKFNLLGLLRMKCEIFFIKWKNLNQYIIGYNFNDYVAEVISVIKILNIQEKLEIIGHCLGGNIAFAAAYLMQDRVRNLTLLTTPWCFSHFKLLSLYSQYVRDYEMIPALFIEIMFFLRAQEDFWKQYYNSHPLSDAIFSWLHSGNNMSRNCFLQIIDEFIEKNALMNNRWYVENEYIDPTRLSLYTKIIACSNDKIVPISSSEILANLLPNKKLYTLNSGHINYLINPKFRDIMQEIFLT